MTRPTLEVADILRASGSSFWEWQGSHLAWQLLRRPRSHRLPATSSTTVRTSPSPAAARLQTILTNGLVNACQSWTACGLTTPKKGYSLPQACIH